MNCSEILVLKGGISTEREVSLRSGAAVASALREAGFSVTELDLSPETAAQIPQKRPDAVFIALHGKGGEDGSVQGLLDWMNLPYTGPGVGASALCMDKILTKKVLRESGVATPDFSEWNPWDSEAPEDWVRRAARNLDLPLVLKAARQGSSIGTVIAKTQEEAVCAVAELRSFGDGILAETFLSGMELTVPILGNDKLLILPVIEITSRGEFYDYDSKYAAGGSEHIIPARIPAETEKAVKELAAAAYRATGCQGHARVDVMLDSRQNPYVIEINTSPGMTETSLFPDAARAVGMSFAELVTEMIRLAREK